MKRWPASVTQPLKTYNRAGISLGKQPKMSGSNMQRKESSEAIGSTPRRQGTAVAPALGKGKQILSELLDQQYPLPPQWFADPQAEVIEDVQHHLRYGQIHPWQGFHHESFIGAAPPDYNGRGMQTVAFVIPSPYQIIATRHLAYLHLKASQCFDEVIDQELSKAQVTRHPLRAPTQDVHSPFLFDVLAVWAAKVIGLSHEEESSRHIASYDIVQSIMSQGTAGREEAARDAARIVCREMRTIMDEIIDAHESNQ